MFDKTGTWTPLKSFEDFDNGLSDLIDLWSSTGRSPSKTAKQAALVRFKQDLEAATLAWADNKAKSKSYAAIATELAEFEEVLQEF